MLGRFGRCVRGMLCALLAALLLAAAFPAYAQEGGLDGIAIQPPGPAREEAAWAVCIYMCGTDLESNYGAGTKDLLEMLAVDLPDDVRLLVMTGGTRLWNPQLVKDEGYLAPQNRRTQLYEIKGRAMELVKDYDGNLDMGDPRTAALFLEDCLRFAPAEQMMLTFWNHGGGPFRGAAFDEYTKDPLTLAELRAVLGALREARGKPLELLGFDACLMNNLETACMLAPYADYMVASEEKEPTGGWCYRWLEALAGGGPVSPVEIGRAVVDAYAYTLNEEGDWGKVNKETLALVDLSRMGDLRAAFHAMAEELLSIAAGDGERLLQVARAAEKAQAMSPGYGLLDLYDFLCQAGGQLESAQAVLDVLGAPPGERVGEAEGEAPAVLYRGTGYAHSRSLGMAFFYPSASALPAEGEDDGAQGVDYIEGYRAFGISDAYADFLGIAMRQAAGLRFGGRWQVGFSPSADRYAAWAQPSQEQEKLASVRFLVMEEGGGDARLLGSVPAVEREGAFWADTALWAYQAGGEPFTMLRTGDGPEGEGYCQIPIALEENGEKVTGVLEGTLSPSGREVTATAITLDAPRGGGVPRTIQPEAGMALYPALLRYDPEKLAGGTLKSRKPAYGGQPVLLREDGEGGCCLEVETKELPAQAGGYLEGVDMQNGRHLSQACGPLHMDSFAQLQVDPIGPQACTGEALEPPVRFTFGGARALLEEGVDYTLAYRDNVEPGRAAVTATSLLEGLPGSLTAGFTVYDPLGYQGCRKGAACPLSAFGDLSPAGWYHDGVHYSLESGLLNGVGGGRFAPGAATTRAMTAAMLYRLEGSPPVEGDQPFRDVPEGAWYSGAVNWAAAQGIITGLGDGRFAPDSPVTREQLAAMLWRYARYKGQDASAGGAPLPFPDGEEVSGYAAPAMQWACDAGIIQGLDGRACPKGLATRAQAATVFMRWATH